MSETSKFIEDIRIAAKQKADAIINDANAETQKALESAKAQTEREVEEIISSAKAEAEGVRRRRISEARHKLKLQEQNGKSRILDEVLEQAKQRIAEAVKDESEYIPYLTGLIESGIREMGLGSAVVHLTGTDLKRIDKAKIEREILKKLDTSVKVEWSKEPIMAMGGTVISSLDGKTRIVSTVDQTLDALEPKLLVEAGKILFGE